jgi:hypothetical protein
MEDKKSMSLIEEIQSYLAQGGACRDLLSRCREALVQVEIDKINSMSQYDLCKRWRFAPVGDPWFNSNLPIAEVFRKRLFEHFCGFTPEISKQLTP